MKRFYSTFMLALVAMTAASCGGGQKDERRAEIIDAEGLSYAELVEKAKTEVGENEVVVYGNSSQLVKALKKFTTDTGIKVKSVKEGDADLYNHLGAAFQSGQYICDMALLQDGNKLQTEMLDTNYMTNFVPKDVKDLVADDDEAPMAAVYLNKIFMYNNTKDGVQGGLTNYVTNVWQLAGTAADAGHIANPSFKTPSTENVNMNFLAMLTSPQWVEKLTAAYKDFYGVDYDGSKDNFQNIGYKWVAEFLTNSQAHSSDGTACKDVAKGQAGSIALVNYNKIKDCKGSGVGAEDAKNLSFPSLELGDTKVKGFGGFCYKMYSMVATNAKYPYAACALVNYITSKAGFENAWGTLAGYYSTNSSTAIASNDKEIAWWKDRLVIEDPSYVARVYRDFTMFEAQYEAK